MWLIVLSARFDQSLVSPVFSCMSRIVAVESLTVLVGAPGVARHPCCRRLTFYRQPN